ncbi:MAG: CHASE2 domain-containing protein [Candidatus Omnitrophota bacterium]|nr:CHASE2 domain-containing protein [Candidatus Omnitrophota bacterium]
MKSKNIISTLKGPLFLILIGVVLFTAYFRIFIHSPIIKSGRLKSSDYFFQLRHQNYQIHAKDKLQPKDIVMVSIDETSYYNLKISRPWSREIFASLLDKINQDGPKVIVLDINLFGQSGVSWGNPEIDQKFADAIKRCGNVVLLAFYGKEEGERLYFGPEKMFAEASAAYGATGAVTDPDGLIRRLKIYSLVFNDKNPVNIAFEVKAALRYMDTPYDTFTNGGHFVTFKSKYREVNLPVDDKNRMLINYVSDFNDIKNIPVWKALEGDFPAKTFKGKLVLVCDTGKSFHDIHQTPFGLRAGGLVIANVINSIISSNHVREVDPALAFSVVALLYVLCFILFYHIEDALKGLLSLIVVIGAFLGTVFFLFMKYSIVWQPFDVLILLPTLFFAMTLYRNQVERLITDKINALANMDSLTSLYNYWYFLPAVNTAVEEGPFKPKCSLLAIKIVNIERISSDLDFEKSEGIHKKIGELLETKAKEVKKSFASYLELGEFAIFLPKVDSGQALGIAGSLKDAIKNANFGIEEEHLRPVIAIGVSTVNPEAFPKTGDDLIESAWLAAKRAEEIGPNKVCRYNPEIDGAKSERVIPSEDMQKISGEEYGPTVKILEQKNRGLVELLRRYVVQLKKTKKANVDTLYAVVEAQEKRDPPTGGHAKRAAELVKKVGQKLKMPQDKLELLEEMTLLHDIGKINIDDSILRKPGKLTDEERVIIEMHTDASIDILGKSEHFRGLLNAIRDHHERLDGSGYPRGLKGDQISLEAQLIAIVDVYDALTAIDRPYRKAASPKEAVDEFISHPEKYNQKVTLALKEVLEQEGKLS